MKKTFEDIDEQSNVNDKDLLSMVVDQNDYHEVLKVLTDFKSYLLSIREHGSFTVALCETDGGFGLCMEESGSGTCYNIKFETLNQAVWFFTNEFLCVENRSFTKNINAQLCFPREEFTDVVHELVFEHNNGSVAH